MTLRSIIYKAVVFFSILCLLVFFSIGCKKKDSSSGGVSSKTINISGKVSDENGAPVKNATATLGTHTVNIKDDGTFQFTGIGGQDIYKIEVKANGYFTAYKNADDVNNSNLNVAVTMLAKTSLGTIDATGGTAGTQGLRIVASNSSFKKPDGTTYTGQVQVSARYVQKDNAFIGNLMPGGDFRATDDNGKEGGMRTYGFVAAEFTGANNDILAPVSGVKAAVTMPAGTNDPVSEGAACWGYDDKSGKWKKCGEVTKDGPEYFFPCTTLYQNIDAFIATGTIQGKVICSGGKPSLYTEVTAINQYNKYITQTNDKGDYKITAEATSTFTYTIEAGDGSTTLSTVKANTVNQASPITVSACGQSQSGSGSFSFNGGNYSGTCSSVPDVGTGGSVDNIDVPILCKDGSSFIVYNMPRQPSGTYNFTDGYDNVGGSVLYGLCQVAGGTQYATRQGTLTKTGINSFTFSCTVYDISTSQSFSVSGSGKY